MKIKEHIDEHTYDRATLYVTECYYSITEQGAQGKRPLIHLCGQQPDGEYRHVTVDGFRPYFFISNAEYEERKHDLQSEINKSSSQIIDVEHGHQGIETGDIVDLVKITCCVPTDVRDTRDDFNRTWEADVLFSDRFLMDMGITDACTIPHGTDSIAADDIRPIDDSGGFEPRIITFDIEVAVGNDGFPDATIADKPITAITAHDSLTDNYWTGVLEHPKWSHDDIAHRDVRQAYENQFPDKDGTVEIFQAGRDDALIYDFIEWVREHHPTVMMAWNVEFDIPYGVNRALNEGCENIKKLSPTEYVTEVENVTWDTERAINGIQIIDNIEAYEKTNVHELKSNKLDDVAEDLLGHGKADIDDIDGGWMDDPEQFTHYNVRDVTAVVDIMELCGAMDLYSNIQSLVGVPLQDINSNKRVIDQAVLREAQYGEFLSTTNDGTLRLPTAVEPDEPWFHGAHVWEPEPGLHEDVVYPDLSALYPNIILTLNISPETLVGTQEELEQSQWSVDDCQWGYVDSRPVKRVPESDLWRDHVDQGGAYKAVGYEGKDTVEWSDDPQPERLYFLDHEIRKGVLTRSVEKIMAINRRYKGTPIYAASKAVRNSVWGYVGDPNSRLFDPRLGECITLCSREVIQHTATQFTDHVTRDSDNIKPRVVMGDTDSCATTMPSVASRDEAIERSMAAAEWINETVYDEFAREKFGVDEHSLFLEIESYAEKIYIHPKKKRYCEHVTWDEGDEVDDIVIKGFECIRSDQAEVTIEAQSDVLEMIVTHDTETLKDDVSERIQDVCEDIESGNYPIEDIGKRRGIGKSLDEYGTANRTPAPIVRGSKYANQNLDATISSGDNPLKYPVERLTDQSLPRTYSADTPEDDREVDYIAVEDPRVLDGKIKIDYSEVIGKYISDPIKPICETMGWNWDEIMTGIDQAAIETYF